MGWQTNNPGGSYTNIGSANKTANKYQVVISVGMARLANNGIAIKFTQNTYQGSSSTYKPPDYMDYRVTITGTTNHSEDWGANSPYVTSKTIWWTGTLGAGQSITVKVGAHDSGGGTFSHATYVDVTKTGPAYTSQYTLSFNGNGNNSGSTAAVTKPYLTTINLPANGFVKTGYNFVGWDANPSSATAQFQPGEQYTISANATLYAIWSQITYAVNYDGNGAESGETASQTKVWGTALPLQQNGYTKTNYTFQHWNTAADDSGTSYAAGASYTANAALSLYAIWKKNNIPVFVNSNGTIIQIEKAFINDGGTIKECVVYQNLGGTIISYQ